MTDLDEQLRHVARAMTAGLELRDPAEQAGGLSPDEGAVERDPLSSAVVLDRVAADGAPPRRRSRRILAPLGLAAAVVGLVVWAGSPPSPSDSITAGTGDGAGGAVTVPTPPPGSPAERLRAAVAATLAAPVEIRVEGVQPPAALMSMQDVLGDGALPSLVGTMTAHLSVVLDGPLETTRFVDGAGIDVPIAVRDVAAGTMSWQVGPGQWQRAEVADGSVRAALSSFASTGCVVQHPALDDALLVTTVEGCSDAMPAGPQGTSDAAASWTVRLSGDGGLASIEPVPSVDADSVETRSVLRFDRRTAAQAVRPPESAVVDVPSPRGWGVAQDTGWAVPTVTTG